MKFKKKGSKKNIKDNTDKKSKKERRFFPTPKIILIDIPDSVKDKLEDTKFRVFEGTFGTQYKVEKSSKFKPIITNHNLPNYDEQDIVIIDLKPKKPLDHYIGEKSVPDKELDFWTKCSHGYIDPRPLSMVKFRDSSDRILNHGGIFIIFACQKLVWDIHYGYAISSFYSERKYEMSNWGFLSCLDILNIDEVSGEETRIVDKDFSITRVLRKYNDKFHYEVCFDIKNDWILEYFHAISLIFNKFDSVIGTIIKPKNGNGLVIILPQISDKSELIYDLLTQVLPELTPNKFTYLEDRKWIYNEEYELKSIHELKEKITILEETFRQKRQELTNQIDQERNKFKFLFGLLTKTGDELVDCVKQALEFIGFEDVRNVDKIIEGKGESKPKQEDLQIHDKNPVILIEIKGLTGLPSESDCNQVIKYVSRRMKDWGHVQVKGVTMINHQRNLPPIRRREAFTTQQINDAINQDILLLTNWDLFILIKGLIEWKWNPQHVHDRFYDSGRMVVLPIHYTFIGKIFNYWEEPSAYGMRISEDVIINKGDRLGYKLKNEFLEEKITSLQIDNRDVENAVKKNVVGIKTIYPKSKLKKGTKVYKVE